MHACTFAHSKESPAGAACLRNVAAIAAANAGGGVVAIDGKALKRGKRRGGKTPYIVNAWAGACGIVLGEVKVDEKSRSLSVQVCKCASSQLTADSTSASAN